MQVVALEHFAAAVETGVRFQRFAQFELVEQESQLLLQEFLAANSRFQNRVLKYPLFPRS